MNIFTNLPKELEVSTATDANSVTNQQNDNFLAAHNMGNNNQETVTISSPGGDMISSPNTEQQVPLMMDKQDPSQAETPIVQDNPERIEEYEYESGKRPSQIKKQMKKYLTEKKKKLMQEDKLSRYKFQPNCCGKYYALCCLNCDKLTKNYVQTICQQLLLPLFIIVIPTFFSFILFLLNSLIPSSFTFSITNDVTPVVQTRYYSPSNYYTCLNSTLIASLVMTQPMRCYKYMSSTKNIIGFTPQSGYSGIPITEVQQSMEKMMPVSLNQVTEALGVKRLVEVPQYRMFPNPSYLDSSILYNKTTYESNCQKGGYIDVSVCPYSPSLSYVDGGLGIKTFDPQSLTLEYFLQTQRTSQVNKLYATSLHRTFLNYFVKNQTQSMGFSFIESFPINLSSLLSSAYVDTLTLLLFPLALSFLLPYYAADIVTEKNRNLIEYVKMYGVSEMEYNFFRFFFDIGRYFVIMIFLVVLGFLSQNNAFLLSRWYLLILDFVIWGFTQVAMGYLLSFLTNTPRKATLIGYFLSLGSMITGAVINIFVFDTTMPAFYFMLYPPFAMIRVFAFLMMEYNKELTKIDRWNAIFCLIYLFVETVILFSIVIVVFFIDFKYYWLKFTYFLEKCCLAPCTECCCAKKYKKFEEGEMDDDVRDEKNMIEEGFIPEDSVLVLKNVGKSYFSLQKLLTCSAPKKAVSSISLTLKDSEVFGMLGPNGAGKSTLIKVLTGEHKPTKGEAIVAGYFLTSELSTIRQRIGVCPQFDIIWEQLTVREILLFFARLRGISIFQERSFVERMIKDFGLEEARRRAAGALSGGMRRRLSVAVSMVGDPKIVFLDEPTTGLDPASKRGLWEIILKARKRHCIVLTTHSMEEAEALCDRLGMVVNGRLACLGTLLHLKQKFGKGYKIQVSLDRPEERLRVFNFLKSSVLNPKIDPETNDPIPETDAQEVLKAEHLEISNNNNSGDEGFEDLYLDEEFGTSLLFRAPSSRVQLSKVFKIMNSRAHLYGIRDWSISQASLEEVFLKLAKRQYDLLKG